MTRVNVILWKHRGGQVAGADIVQKLLQSVGCETRLIITSQDQPDERYRADVNLFSSELHPDWLKLAKKNVLLANHEQDARQSSQPPSDRCSLEKAEQVEHLRRVDTIFAKSRYAERLYRDFGLPATYVGFTSRDRLLPEVERSDREWLFLIGDNHRNKDCPTVMNVWRADPTLPLLHVVTSRGPRDTPFPALPNVQYHLQHLSDDETRRLQNRCRVHVCATRMEGWSHAIVEGMSCGAVVMTTDAPPMNEHIDGRTGVLFAAESRSPHNLDYVHKISPSALSGAARGVMAMPDEMKRRIGANARAYFERAAREFPERFLGAWNTFASW
jgi:hypothetical protein